MDQQKLSPFASRGCPAPRKSLFAEKGGQKKSAKAELHTLPRRSAATSVLLRRTSSVGSGPLSTAQDETHPQLDSGMWYPTSLPPTQVLINPTCRLIQTETIDIRQEEQKIRHVDQTGWDERRSTVDIREEKGKMQNTEMRRIKALKSPGQATLGNSIFRSSAWSPEASFPQWNRTSVFFLFISTPSQHMI